MDIEEKKGNKLKYILLGILGIIVLVTLIVILSTYFSWKNEGKNLNKVMAYKYDDSIVYVNDKDIVKVNSVKDFYDKDINLELDDNEYVYLYCDTENNCTYMENSFFIHPGIVIFGCVFILLLIIYFIIKDLKWINFIIKIIIASIILASGIVLIFMEVYDLFDYYFLVNNNNNMVEGAVTGYVNKKNEVIEYIVDDVKYIYINKSKSKNIEINKSVNVYYKDNNRTIAEIKRNPLVINYFIYGLLLIGESIMYFKLIKKDK